MSQVNVFLLLVYVPNNMYVHTDMSIKYTIIPETNTIL